MPLCLGCDMNNLVANANLGRLFPAVDVIFLSSLFIYLFLYYFYFFSELSLVCITFFILFFSPAYLLGGGVPL